MEVFSLHFLKRTLSLLNWSVFSWGWLFSAVGPACCHCWKSSGWSSQLLAEGRDPDCWEYVSSSLHTRVWAFLIMALWLLLLNRGPGVGFWVQSSEVRPAFLNWDLQPGASRGLRSNLLQSCCKFLVKQPGVRLPSLFCRSPFLLCALTFGISFIFRRGSYLCIYSSVLFSSKLGNLKDGFVTKTAGRDLGEFHVFFSWKSLLWKEVSPGSCIGEAFRSRAALVRGVTEGWCGVVEAPCWTPDWLLWAVCEPAIEVTAVEMTGSLVACICDITVGNDPISSSLAILRWHIAPDGPHNPRP